MVILMVVCPAQEQPAPQGTSVPKEKVFKSAAWLMGMMMAHGLKTTKVTWYDL